MNYDKKTISSIIVIALLCVAALVFLYGKAPDFRAKTDAITRENAVLERDIADIEAAAGDPEKIDRDIAELKAKIDAYSHGRTVNAEGLQARLTKLCKDAGVEPGGISAGAPSELAPAGIYAPALLRCEATILFYGEEGAGYALLQMIENDAEGDFEIVSFAYQKNTETELENVGDWTVAVAVYYYGEIPDA
jgi:hypothetical protein